MKLKIRARYKHYVVNKIKKFWRQHRNLRHVKRAEGTEASSLMNSIIGIRELAGAYLEIGVESGFTFEAVNLKNKSAVDPKFLFNKWTKSRSIKLYETTSDAYFELNNGSNLFFDLVYLDGLHTFEQTYMDLGNTFQFLHSNSIVIIDDTVPCDSYSSNPVQKFAYETRISAGIKNDGSWHGDVFKLVCTLNYLNLPELNYRTLVDLQNPKTVVWLKQGFEWPKKLPDLNRKLSESFTYSKYFEPKISEVFHPTTKSKFLEEIRVD